MSTSTTESARLLAAQRRQVKVTCVGCGVQVTGTVRRRYCTQTCLVRTRRRTQAAARARGTAPA